MLNVQQLLRWYRILNINSSLKIIAFGKCKVLITKKPLKRI